MQVRTCPFAERKEIAHNTAEMQVAMATTRTEKLPQAILAKAFRGESVPTEAELARRGGWSYKTASELLSLIKSELEEKGK